LVFRNYQLIEYRHDFNGKEKNDNLIFAETFNTIEKNQRIFIETRNHHALNWSLMENQVKNLKRITAIVFKIPIVFQTRKSIKQI
jgi:hypothetical protein